MKNHFLILPFLVLTTLVASCSGGGNSSGGVDNAEASESLTAPASEEDSTLHFTNGLTLEIPAGALEADTEITVSVLSSTPTGADDAVGSVYSFAPEGLEFLKAVTLSIPYNTASFGESSPALAFSTKDDSTVFEQLDTTINGDATLSASISHFSMAYAAPFSTDLATCGLLALEVMDANPDNSKFVFGKAEFNADGVRPMRSMQVRVTLDDSTELSTSTDNDGCYALAYSAAAKIENVEVVSSSGLSPACTTNSASINYSNSDGVISAYGFPSNEDKNATLVSMVSISTSSHTEQVYPQTELDFAFSLIDSAWTLSDIVCQAVPSAEFPVVVFLEESGNLTYDDGIINLGNLDNLVFDRESPSQAYHVAAHFYAHALQDSFYSTRDVDNLYSRYEDYDHVVSEYQNDARHTFYEGYAEAMGAVVTESVFGVEEHILSLTDADNGLWLIDNNASVIFSLATVDGYEQVHNAYTDLANSPVFQTLHSFGYYYIARSGSYVDDFKYAGLSEDSFDDLYDLGNTLGQAVDSDHALYPTIVVSQFQKYVLGTDTELCAYGEDSSAISNPDELSTYFDGYGAEGSNTYDGYGEDGYYTYLKTAVCDPDVLSGENNEDSHLHFRYYSAVKSEPDGLYWYDASATYDYLFNVSDSVYPFTSLPLSAGHNSREHDSLALANSRTASRWYVVDGDYFTTQEEYDAYPDSKVEADIPALRIADDGAGCTHELTISVYFEGELYAEETGNCPVITDMPQGLAVVEVWADEDAADVDCFAFMEEGFCDY